LASSLDQVGPATKSVADAAYLLDLISGSDINDATSLDSTVGSYHSALDELDLKKLRIGLPEEYFGSGVDKKIAEMVRDIAKKIEGLGASVELVSLPTTPQALSVYYVLMPSEASSNLARYDGIRFGQQVKAETVLDTYLKTREAGFGDEPKRRILLGTYALSSGYYDAFYKRALAVRQLIKDDFEKAWQSCDLLIAPTTPTTAFKFGQAATPLQMYANDILTIPSNLAGNCALSLPIGLIEGLPVGLQIIGPHLSEEKVLQLAKKIEDIADFQSQRSKK
jgi:aspartyl-tRNA(Asn)/glutamyl-tRNA(Gln) amidotransferase subunit A